jgi:Xaa-Pro aminopeptidase
MAGTARLLIAGTDSDILYATGLRIHDPFVWIQMGKKNYILVSPLELARAKQEAKRSNKVVCWDRIDTSNIRKPVGRRRNQADIAASVLISFNITEVMVPESIWALHVEILREHGLRVRIASPFFPQRMRKSPEEIAAIKRSGLITKKAFNHCLRILKESTIDWNDTLIHQGKRLTSEMLKEEMHRIFLAGGFTGGDIIVSCGEQSAQPHNTGTGLLYAGQPIVFDIFPRDDRTGYYFDMSRTVVKGTPSEDLRRMHAAVRNAQLAGIAAVKPGAKASDAHAACQAVFDRLGYKTYEEEGFIHSTGHGVGLDLHERPSIGVKSDEILEPGMVITIEPGLYYKEIGGVRIEDTVLVSPNGCVNLTNVPKSLIIK